MTQRCAAVQRLREAAKRRQRAIDELEKADKELVEAAMALDLVENVDGEFQR